MKTQFLIIAAFAITIGIASCNNSTSNEQVQKIKSLAAKDSLDALQTKQKDSLITAYVDDLDDIQTTLDSIKQREKIITMQSPEMSSSNKQSVVDEVKELDDWIVANDRKMNNLQARLRKMDNKDAKLQNLVTRLQAEVAEKDSEIVMLQGKLGKSNDSLKMITARFNDSITVMRHQREQMGVMTTVYYAIGTMKDLKDKGIIDKSGGIIGIGRVAELNPNANNTAFIKSNMGSLKAIGLNGKFRRFITTHPDKSYQISGSGKSDTLYITEPDSFWKESKYLVLAIK